MTHRILSMKSFRTLKMLLQRQSALNCSRTDSTFIITEGTLIMMISTVLPLMEIQKNRGILLQLGNSVSGLSQSLPSLKRHIFILVNIAYGFMTLLSQFPLTK